MTYEQFKIKAAEKKAQTEKLRGEIEALTNQRAKLTDDILAAAASGDLELYETKVDAQEKVDKAITVKKAFLAHRESSVTEKDARSTWSSYVTDYSKKLKSGLAAYQKEKAALCEKYGALIELQRAALEVRETISAVSGIDANSFELDCIPVHSPGAQNGSLTRINGFGCSDPDAVFYLAEYMDKKNIPVAYVTSDPCFTKVYRVLVDHKSK